MDAKALFENLCFYSAADYHNKDKQVSVYLEGIDQDEIKREWSFGFYNQPDLEAVFRSPGNQTTFKTRKEALEVAQSFWLTKHSKPFDEHLVKRGLSIYYLKNSAFSIQGNKTWRLASYGSKTTPAHHQSVFQNFLANNDLEKAFKTRKQAVEAFVEKYYCKDNKIKLFGL